MDKIPNWTKDLMDKKLNWTKDLVDLKEVMDKRPNGPKRHTA